MSQNVFKYKVVLLKMKNLLKTINCDKFNCDGKIFKLPTLEKFIKNFFFQGRYLAIFLGHFGQGPF